MTEIVATALNPQHQAYRSSIICARVRLMGRGPLDALSSVAHDVTDAIVALELASSASFVSWTVTDWNGARYWLHDQYSCVRPNTA